MVFLLEKEREQSTWKRTCFHVMRSPVASPDKARIMSPLEKLDRQLEFIIRELTLRIVTPRLGEFDLVWEVAGRVCDRYGISQTPTA